MITPAGRALRKRMWPVYRESVEARFARHVSEREAGAMSAALERVLRADRHGDPATSKPVGKAGGVRRG